MKKTVKISAAVITAGLLIPNALVLAAPKDDFEEALSRSIYSANAVVDMNMTIDNISDELCTAMDIEKSDLVMNIITNCSVNSSENLKKMQCEADVTMKVGNEDSIKTETWTDMDFTDEENPMFKTISKIPDEEKYMVMDYSQLQGNDALMETLKNSMDVSKVQSMNTMLKEVLPQKEPEYKDGIYTVRYSDADMKNTIKNTLLVGEDIYLPLIKSISGIEYNSVPSDTEITDEMRAEYKADIERISDKLNAIQLFDNDEAVVLNVTLDDNKNIKTMDIDINVDTNLYKIVSVIADELKLTDEDMSDFKKNVTEENSNIKASISMKCEYNNVNEPITIEFPTLTEENSTQITAFQSIPLEVNAEPLKTEDSALIPLRAFCNAIGITDEKITYDKGVITIITNGVYYTTEINSNIVTVVVNGNEQIFNLSDKAVLVDETTYMPLDFARIFGVNAEYNSETEKIDYKIK